MGSCGRWIQSDGSIATTCHTVELMEIVVTKNVNENRFLLTFPSDFLINDIYLSQKNITGKMSVYITQNTWYLFVVHYQILLLKLSLLWTKLYRLNQMKKKGQKGHMRGTYVYVWLTHIDVWQKPTQYCRAIIRQLKINKIF